jgi:hypothetical protein
MEIFREKHLEEPSDRAQAHLPNLETHQFVLPIPGVAFKVGSHERMEKLSGWEGGLAPAPVRNLLHFAALNPIT